MLHVDIPTRNDFAKLLATRADACVTIYLATTPLTQHIDACKIELRNLADEAKQQLEDAGFDKRRLALIAEEIQELIEDSDFWAFQANSLAVFVTPDQIRTFRLGNKLTSMVQVSDRFHLQPLFRAATFSHSALVLAISENDVRLVEVQADLPPVEVKVPNMPKDFSAIVNKSDLNDKSQRGQMHGLQGQNVRLHQYARKIDAALRPFLAGQEVPLILAATGRLADVFRQVNSYPHLAEDGISTSPDRVSESELAAQARPILDAVYKGKIDAVRALFDQRSDERRGTTDISDAARAATFGMIATLLVDIDAVIPGFVDEETGAVSFVKEDDAKAYGIIDEIAARAHATGAEVLGVRKQDIPGNKELAAILRYPL